MEKQGEFVPQRLVGVSPRIKGLWWRGDIELVQSERVVAIVGSRKMSLYGKRVLSQLVPELISRGYVTISGFMYGIDIEMHRLTVENGGKTIGVLGWGIEAPITNEHDNLYHKVIQRGGLFLSELPPQQLATLWSFPARNRIVVGMCDMVIVVEASIKSGSLNSAAWARKMGKPVYAVPGSIFSNVSEGCNWLIEQSLAKPMTMDYFVGPTQKAGKNYSNKVRIGRLNSGFTMDESSLVAQLRIEGPKSINELARLSNQPVGEIAALLSGLLLRGEVEMECGVWKIA